MSSDLDPSAPAPEPAPAETPARHVAEVQKKKNLYLRITSSMPLLVTVIVHLVLIGIAGAVVVQQNIVGKKKTFEASNTNEGATQQVEHRLQVARRGGASGGATSPVSANRIYSTAAGALAMPEMPDLPSMGAGGFGGFGGMGSGVGLGAGVGMATSLGGGTGLGGRGFMSLSFLGSTSQNVSRIVFVVDVSPAIMDIRKGGFQAFAIIREEIMRLVGRLPPGAQFNVVLFEGSGDDNNTDVNLYERELVAATSENKKDFFAWMAPVNAKLGSYGPSSAARRTGWRRRPLPPETGIDPLFLPPVWSRATQAALEQKPDVIYVITASDGQPKQRVDEKTLAERRARVQKEREEFEKEVAKEGLDPNAVRSARDRAYDKAGRELAAANRKLVAEGKDPIVVRWNDQIFRSDVQAALRKHGIKIELDKTGWTKKDGSTFRVPSGHVSGVENTTWNDFYTYYTRVQSHFVPERPRLNVFLFVGPNDKAEGESRNLSTIAKRNGGTFQLLTTKRLEEIKAREEAATKG